MERLYFITHCNDRFSYLESGLLALGSGIRLVQLRMKDCPREEVIRVARCLKSESEKYGAQLIMNDSLDLALETGFAGVHLGQTDGEISKAREQSGKEMIIGKTCNTWEQVLQASNQKADYIGAGPFRFTSTKKKLSPRLGLQGYRDIVSKCRKNGIDTPIYAIGGIGLEDVEPLMETGISGIAVSSLILESPNPERTIAELRKKLEKQ